jgi:hypothetical protein
MPATTKRDLKSPAGDVIARLRVPEYDRLTASKGVKSVAAAAELHGFARTRLFDYRAGRKTPRLDVAMRMAKDLGVRVEEIFELRQAA